MPAMPPTDAPEDSSLERVRPGRAALRTLLPRRGAAGGARRAPARSILTLAIVTGLMATVAIPAYAAWKPETEAKTLQQLAADGAQTLVVASDVGGSTLARGSYSATTPEEIAKKKAAEAAAARAKPRSTDEPSVGGVGVMGAA
ncbi:hypothetical protein [Microbacterium lacus]|uniref:hypothetical protein n=1 Tax=Microbacterium lacus TaxID=415217 RepID=UPI000C2BCA82|nr:hypothetical protein [Microbacterium lacus]